MTSDANQTKDFAHTHWEIAVRSTFLVISFDDLDERNLDTKQIQAETKKEAIEKSGFSSAVAILSETSEATYANGNRKPE